MVDIKQLLADTSDIENLLESLEENQTQLVTGLSGSARTLVISTILEKRRNQSF